MRAKDIPQIIRILKTASRRFKTPFVTEASARLHKDPYSVLVSCILSLRTKDEITRATATRLLKAAPIPEKLARLSAKEIEKTIYPAGFYRRKAVVLKEIAEKLISVYSSKVPDGIDELLKLKGVGRKTANLVVTMGFNKPGICVDAHVHRITNRWGFVSTKNPDETELALRGKLDKRYWIRFNGLLVTYGQNICKPISPLCSQCGISKLCARKGVGKSR